MAWIRKRRRSDGGTTYTVTWREPGDIKESTISFPDDLPKAEETVRLLDANGQSFEAASAVLRSAKMDGPTIYEAMGRHIDQLVDAGPYQIGRYRSARERYFKNGFGSMRVKGVERQDVARWLKDMQRLGLAPKTIANHHTLLSGTFKTAVHDRVIDFNPARDMKLPKAHAATDDDYPTADDWLLIREQLDPFFVPFFEFLVGTGLRFGEATALRASDFKLGGSVPLVDVRRAWKQNGDGTYYMGQTKTVKGRRTVSLAPYTLSVVMPLIQAAGDDLVFRLKRGGPMRSPAVHGRIWQPAVKKARAAGLDKHVTIHGLRHLHAALMLESDMNIYDLSRRLGHTSIQMTIDLYSRLMPDAHFRGAEVAARALAAFVPADVVELEPA